MDKRRAIEASIAEYAKRLAEIGQGDEQSKRVKKRILQKLGKLKKDLAAAGGVAESGSGAEPTGDLIDKEDSGKTDVPTMSKEERKLKLRLLNKDLAEFAQKKQLTLAKKRFEQAVRKGIKVDVHSYTNLINAYVRCSDLRGAEDTVKRMRSEQIQPNLVTYTALLKGYSENGDMNEVSRIYFECMNDDRGPNVRSLNTFLRACVRTGTCKPALQSFYDFLQRHSDSRAEFQPAAKKQKTSSSGASASVTDTNDADYSCDASTYEYLIGLLCRSGNLALAEHVLTQFTAASAKGSSGIAAGGVSAIENTAIYIAFATAEALLRGDYPASRKWCDLAVDALKRTETATLKDSMLKRFQQAEGSAGSAGSGAGSKRGADDDGRSVALFLKHRRTELERQLESVQEYLGAVTHRSGGAGGAGGVAGKVQAAYAARAAYVECLSQVLHFGFDGRCDYDAHRLTGPAAAVVGAVRSGVAVSAEDAIRTESEQPHIAARLLLALRDKYGLEQCTLPALEDTADAEATKLHKALKAALNRAKTDVAEKMFRTVDADSGYINFPSLFSPLGRQQDQRDTVDLAALPVKLEICSGDGEWVVAQAGADWSNNTTATVSAGPRQPRALWVALELRCDRIQHTLAHYLLSRPTTTATTTGVQAAGRTEPAEHTLHNLALLSGNAAKIIPERVAAGSIAEIFINHPQPPDRVTGGGSEGKSKSADKNQGAHLLTQDFLAQLLRVLKPGGTITIVTDNQAYGKSLAASLASLPAQGQTAFVGGVDRYKLPPDWDHSLDDSHAVQALTTAGSTDKTALPRTVDLWRGEAGPEVGHVTSASSYFDRMWDLGQKKRRWFIYVRKAEL